MRTFAILMLMTLSFASVSYATEIHIAGGAYSETNRNDCIGLPIPSYANAEIAADKNAAFRCGLDQLKARRISEFTRDEPKCFRVGFGPPKRVAVYVSAYYVCE